MVRFTLDSIMHRRSVDLLSLDHSLQIISNILCALPSFLVYEFQSPLVVLNILEDFSRTKKTLAF